MTFYVSIMAAVFLGVQSFLFVDAPPAVGRPRAKGDRSATSLASASGTDRGELDQIISLSPVGMNRGDTVYLRLAGFKPEWRQAVVISGKPGRSLQLAVRISKEEAESKAGLLSSFVVEKEIFILVEGDLSRLRPTCTFPCRALELEVEKIMEKASELQSSDEHVQYATASEHPAEQAPRKKKEELSSSSEEESEGSGDEVFQLLSRAAKVGIEPATGFEKHERKRSSKMTSRYPLLAQKEASKGSSSSALPKAEDLLKSVLSSSSTNLDGSQLNALIQMELLRELRGKKEKKKDRQESPSEKSSSSQESSSDEDKERLRGAGKAMKAFRKSKKRMKKNPEKHIRRYIKDVEDFLGVGTEGAYVLTDYTKKLAWGKQRTLMRYHFALSDLLQTILKGKLKLAGLKVTQLLRATHQASLDQGDWRTAWLLLDLADPLERPRFGGEAQQLEVVASYVTAMANLEKKGRWQPNRGNEEDLSSGRGKGKRKGKKGEKEEEPEG
eukprot:s363_g24.t1